MLVMLSNNTGAKVRELWKKYPERLGCMISPNGWREVPQPYAIDNGRFSACTNDKEWSKDDFRTLCDKAASNKNKPIFITVPDVVGDAKKTKKEWGYWTRPQSWLHSYEIPLAFVMQDGMTLDDIPPNADWVFVGGSQKWKRSNIYKICNGGKRYKNYPKVHIGGINSARRLWICHKAGAKSVDGTGWCRGDAVRWVGLLQYLYRSTNNLNEKQRYLFDLYESDAMGARIEFDKTLAGLNEKN